MWRSASVCSRRAVSAVCQLVFLVYLALCIRLSTSAAMLPLGTLSSRHRPALCGRIRAWLDIIGPSSSRRTSGALPKLARQRGAVFYIPRRAGGPVLPWSLLLSVALRWPWRRIGARQDGRCRHPRTARAGLRGLRDLRLLLALWITVIVGFFSLSGPAGSVCRSSGAAPLVGGLHLWTFGQRRRRHARSGLTLLAVSLSWLQQARRPRGCSAMPAAVSWRARCRRA
jgi:hypothetical protein